MTTKNNAKKNIKFKVNLLDVASHINKLIPGLEIEGKTNGNIAIVAVKITPAIVNAENKKAKPQRFVLEKTILSKALPTANTGNNHKIGISL